MKPFQIILIGLSIILFSGCVLTEIDPPEKYYLEKYFNSSNQTVTIKMLDVSEMVVVKSFTLLSGDERSGIYQELYFNGGDSPVKNYIDDLIRNDIQKIELYLGDILVKEWIPEPSGNYNLGENNPFNQASWIVQPVTASEGDFEGKILFTITSKDIGN